MAMMMRKTPRPNHLIGEAGLAKSSFYHYFPDKQRLHDHVVLTLCGRLSRGLHLPDLDSLDADSYWPAMTAMFSSMARRAVGRSADPAPRPHVPPPPGRARARRP